MTEVEEVDAGTGGKGQNKLIVNTSHSVFKRKPSTMAELLAVLKEGGGVENGPAAKDNEKFLRLLDLHFPELSIYCTGKIQTSPGVEEIEGSPTEYYRTVGAMIGLLACYAYVQGDDFGIQAVSAGQRGPMSMDKIPGKFINIGNKPDDYKQFCTEFATGMPTEEDWWAMMVFLAVHDVGKSDAFRNAVNATLPPRERSDDHDRCLAKCLLNLELKEKYLPTVNLLSPKRQEMLAAGFKTNFQLPQLGQGEIAVVALRGLLDLPREHLYDGALRNYLYHSIFDIAGSSCNEKFIYPIALGPVYTGFTIAMNDLVTKLQNVSSAKPDQRALYFDFLYSGFAKAYPEFCKKVFDPLAVEKIFRNETGLVLLRILALTRNTYKNPQNVLTLLQSGTFTKLGLEMAGNPVPPGPQVMLYYGPDLLRMGLGTDMEDVAGANMKAALTQLENFYKLARDEIAVENLSPDQVGDSVFQLNVQPVVSVIKDAGKSWSDASLLKDVCEGTCIEFNPMRTEGIVALNWAAI